MHANTCLHVQVLHDQMAKLMGVFVGEIALPEEEQEAILSDSVALRRYIQRKRAELIRKLRLGRGSLWRGPSDVAPA